MSPIPEAEAYHFFIERDRERLDALLRVLPIWRRAAEDELGEVHARMRAQPGGIPDEVLDDLADEHSMLDDTDRDLRASLSVHVASTVESWIRALCRLRSVLPLGRPTWGALRNALQNELAVDFDALDGFDQATRARVLGNCFKHNGGNKNDEFVQRYGGNEGERVEYENENYEALITRSIDFLHALVGKL